MNYKGKIFRIPFPFTDLKEKKHRPVLAISEPNEYGDIRFAFITKKNYPGRNQIVLKNSDYQSVSLPVTSYLQLDKSVLLNKSIIISDWAELKETTMLVLQRRLVTMETETWYNDRFSEKEFIPGKSFVNYAGRVFDEKEIIICG